MKTKTEIIQFLLDEKKITTEEAVILLTPDKHICKCKKKKQYPLPFIPLSPLSPPYSITCQSIKYENSY